MKSDLNIFTQFFYLIVKLFLEEDKELNSSQVEPLLRKYEKNWQNSGYKTKKNFYKNIQAYLSMLSKEKILIYDDPKKIPHLYYLNPAIDVSDYLRKLSTDILISLDVDIYNVYEDEKPIFDYINSNNLILNHSEIEDIVSNYGRSIIYGV